MAIQTKPKVSQEPQRQAPQHKEKSRREAVRDLVSTLTDALDPYVRTWRLDLLDEAFRAKLSARDRAVIDGILLGMWPG